MHKDQKNRIRQLTQELRSHLPPSERHLTEDVLRLFGEVRRELASVKREKDSMKAVSDKQTERMRNLEAENSRLTKDAAEAGLLREENAELYGELGEQWGILLSTMEGELNETPLPCVNSPGVEKLLSKGLLPSRLLVQMQSTAFLDWFRAGEPPVRIMELKAAEGLPALVLHTGDWLEGEPRAVRTFTLDEYLKVAPYNVMMLPGAPDSPVAKGRNAIINRGSRP